MNKAVFMTGIQKFEVKEIEMPEIKPDEILVQMEYVGVCGSDMHFFEYGKIGSCVVDKPFILGHECAGMVVKTGDSVKQFSVGDRVALEPGIPCGECEFCKSGKYNLCDDVKFISVPPYDGALRQYMAFPANMAFKLPESLSTLEGALMEPLAVGIHAAKTAKVQPGKTVAILGAGCIGLVTLLACRAFGATNIIMTDMFDVRLNKAKELGASTVLNASEADVVEEVMKLTGRKGVDLVFETAGNKISAGQTQFLVKKGGTILLVGNVMEPVEFNCFELNNKEATIKTVFRYRNIFPVAIEACANKLIDISKIASHVFDIDQAQEAFEYGMNHKQEVIKAVIKCR